MGLFERFRRAVPDAAPETYSLAFQLADYQYGKPQWPTWSPEWGGDHGYRRLALIYRCNNLVAHALGTAPVRVYDEDDNGATVPDHPLTDLMKRPNPYMGAAAFWSHVGIRTAVSGFCLVEIERDLDGRPMALWPLVSSWATAIPRKGEEPDWRYRAGGTGEGVVIRSDQCMVFTWADSPMGSPYGQGPLEACLREVSISSAMTDFLKRFFEIGAVPLVGLVPDVWPGQTLTQKQVDQLTEGFTRKHGGLDNAARPAMLTGIKDVKRLGFDMNEMAYVDLRDLSELGIIQAYGIPATVAQVRVGLEFSLSRANAETDQGAFYRNCIIPLWARFDDVLTRRLLPEFSDAPNISLEFDQSDIGALQENRAEKAGWLNPAVQGGWLSVHAWHRELGIPEPDGDDYYLRSIAVTPVPAATPLQDSGPALPGTNQAAIREQKPRQIGPGTILARARPGEPVYDEGYRKAGKDREIILRIAQNRNPSIQRYFREQAERVIPLILDGYAAAPDLDRYTMEAVDWNAEDDLLNTVLTKLRLLAGRTAIQSVKDLHGITVGVDWTLANPEVRTILDRLGFRVRGIGDYTRAQIQDQVTAGIQAGERPEQIKDRLRGLYDEYYRNRSLAIARTESMVAYGEASVHGYQKSGVVDRAEIFDNPEHTDEYGASDGLTCATRDGIIVPLAEAMSHIYADHPNGSATVSPVLAGED